MSTKLDKTIKTGLDETRLLVLGAQVLLGFQFQSFFQDGFSELTQLSKLLCIAGPRWNIGLLKGGAPLPD
jgi:hypothetical protein